MTQLFREAIMSENTKYLLVSENQQADFRKQAEQWYDEIGRTLFPHSKVVAVSSVMEFIANKRGFTMFHETATYPDNQD